MLRTYKILVFLVLGLLILPFFVFASSCELSGVTIVYVNGILTDKDEADEDSLNLSKTLVKNKLEDFSVVNGYNPSHLAGIGDWIKSIQQAYVGKEDIPIDDYDLRNILLQIHNKVKTKKILLVGHSQGTFYTNALYNYLTKNGVPKESIKVYNLATPASFVAGDAENKRYLTSSNDRLIAEVRKLAILGGANPPLDANDTLQSLDDNGHGFSSTYLAGASVKIVSTIDNALDSLVVSAGADSECFAAPPQNLSYTAQKIAFAVADPLAEATYQSGKTGVHNIRYLANILPNTLAAAVDFIKGAEPTQTASVIVAPERTPETGGAPVVEASVIEVTEPIAAPLPEPEPAPLPVLPPVEEPSTTEFAPSTESLEPKFVGFQPGFGGGASPSPASSEPEPEPEPVAVPPASPVITSPLNAYVSTTTIVFSGTAPSDTVISIDFSSATTSADGAGNWSISLSGFPEGAATVNFYATDATGLMSSPATVSFSVDTIAPGAVTFSIAECTLSLVAGGCTVASGTASLSWLATDADYYGVFDNGALLSTTTSLASSVALAAGTHVFKVASYDVAGNSAVSSPATTTAVVLPSISYYCEPSTSTFLNGGIYVTAGTGCHGYADGVTGLYWMLDTYKGTVGSSTIVVGNSFSFNPFINTLDYVYSSALPGDRFFIAIYETRSGPAFNGESSIFRNYFKTNANPPPHLNFGIINWVYGP